MLDGDGGDGDDKRDDPLALEAGIGGSTAPDPNSRVPASIAMPDDPSADPKECRICLSDEDKHLMIQPCLCKGSQRWIHRACLDQWRATKGERSNGFTHCGTCKFKFQIRVRHLNAKGERDARCRYRTLVCRDLTFFVLGIHIVLSILGFGLMSVDRRGIEERSIEHTLMGMHNQTEPVPDRMTIPLSMPGTIAPIVVAPSSGTGNAVSTPTPPAAAAATPITADSVDTPPVEAAVEAAVTIANAEHGRLYRFIHWLLQIDPNAESGPDVATMQALEVEAKRRRDAAAAGTADSAAPDASAGGGDVAAAAAAGGGATSGHTTVRLDEATNRWVIHQNVTLTDAELLRALSLASLRSRMDDGFWFYYAAGIAIVLVVIGFVAIVGMMCFGARRPDCGNCTCRGGNCGRACGCGLGNGGRLCNCRMCCVGGGAGAGEASVLAGCLLIALLALALFGLIIAIGLGAVYAREIVNRHVHILWLKSETERQIVVDLNPDAPPAPNDDMNDPLLDRAENV